MYSFNPKVIAFYLPQYHPVRENSEWFGPGFTEWTLVANAKPLFKGHIQPKIPADLGFYDLRVPEVREEQARLAKEANVYAFCYYHYWFGNGKVLLESPLNSIIQAGSPDFPFCLCWANHSWFKKQWNPKTSLLDESLLVEQTYPGEEDIVNHFNYLLPIFKDSRYLKICGKLAFVIYAPKSMPDSERLITIWNELAIKNNLPGFYFISYANNVPDVNNECHANYNATILALISNVEKKGRGGRMAGYVSTIKDRLSKLLNKPLSVYEYSKAMRYFLDPLDKQDNIFPVIVSNWDYTPRRGVGGLIFKNSTPDLFKKHVLEALEMVKGKPEENQIIFLKSWNEWGEGNYIEPDLQYGHGYINALHEAIEESKTISK